MKFIAVFFFMVFLRLIAASENVPFTALSTGNVINRNIIVDIHNTLRRTASPTAGNMLKMRWNNDASKTAEIWAKTCNQAHSAVDSRVIPGFKCGENLFLSNFKASWDDVIKSFHSEYTDFEYGKGAKQSGTVIEHYTQVMWYSSFQVGCYVQECLQSEFRYYYVCHYCPWGNIKGKVGFPYKSGPACADCPESCDRGLCTNFCPYQDKYGNCDEFNKGDSCNTDQSLREDCPGTCLCRNNEIK
ncbi:hypothetical protein GDO86_010557 [Hymenochirus boettgeri]|uniref:ShKT domain-containing protein n=1 Tax=Hymenochirus boettgeri TaxID=247094 RepID=A0A8T2JQH9_9PIPI|nr:hypothetical protein GDO86_010557 [Hymenochirus boettgeri]